jgi:hypothetical protein
MFSLVNVQISTTAKHIDRTDLNDTRVSPNAEGDSQQPHEKDEGTTELHTCSGCVTDIEGSLRKYQLRNGSEETIERHHPAKLNVNLFFFNLITMLLTNSSEAVGEMSPITMTPSNDFRQQVSLACPGYHCPNCEPECSSRFA